jgi:hypothetical protein
MTFEKYLSELLNDHILEKRPDPHDKRAVIITMKPEEARQESLFLETMNKISILKSTQSPEEYYSIARKSLDSPNPSNATDTLLSKQPHVIHQCRMGKLLEISHASFAKAHGIESIEHAYLRVVYDRWIAEVLGKKEPVPCVEILPPALFKGYEKDSFTLHQIASAAKRNPTLMRLINEAIPDFESGVPKPNRQAADDFKAKTSSKLSRQ